MLNTSWHTFPVDVVFLEVLVRFAITVCSVDHNEGNLSPSFFKQCLNVRRNQSELLITIDDQWFAIFTLCEIDQTVSIPIEGARLSRCLVRDKVRWVQAVFMNVFSPTVMVQFLVVIDISVN